VGETAGAGGGDGDGGSADGRAETALAAEHAAERAGVGDEDEPAVPEGEAEVAPGCGPRELPDGDDKAGVRGEGERGDQSFGGRRHLGEAEDLWPREVRRDD